MELIQDEVRMTWTQINEIRTTLNDQAETLTTMNEVIQAINTRIGEFRMANHHKEIHHSPSIISLQEPEYEIPRPAREPAPWSRSPSIRAERPYSPARNPRSPSPDYEGRRRSPPREIRDEIPKGAKAKKPEPFSGKRGQEAETFMMKMEIYFNNYGNAFTDRRKISTTLTNMAEGKASRWAKPFLRRHLASDPHEFLQSWVRFRQAFLTTFSHPIKRERAIQDINKLVQKGSAQSYTAQFRTLAEEHKCDEHALIDK